MKTITLCLFTLTAAFAQTLTVTPDASSKSVAQGTDVTFTFTVTPPSAYSAVPIYPTVLSADPISVDVVPSSGPTCILNSAASVGLSFSNVCSVTGGGTFAVTIHTAGLSIGNHGFTVQGTGTLPDGFGEYSSAVGQARATLTVTSATPDFSLAVDATSKSGSQGTGVPFTITQTALGGFSGTVTLATAGLPMGVSLSPAQITGSGTASLVVHLDATTPGTYPFTFTGTSGSLSHTLNLSVTVTAATTPTVWSTISPFFTSETAGASTATFIVSAAPLDGYTGSVSFGTSGTLDAGISVSFSPTSATITSGAVTSTATVSTLSSTATGSHFIQFTVTPSGGAAVLADYRAQLIVF